MVKIRRWLLIIGVVALMLICSAYAQPGISSQNVSADEIVSKIKSGEPVGYKNISVSGSIDLSSLEGPVKQPVTIINSQLGPVNFEGVSFEEPVDLRSTQFNGNSSFAKATFLADANFAGAKFIGETDFRNVKFSSATTFLNSQFLDDTSFGNAQFGGEAIFLGSRFYKDVDFDYAQFSRLVSFWNAKFENVRFMETEFEGSTGFNYAQFDNSTVFAGTRFGGDAIFRATQFSSNAQFGLASFGGLSDFTNVNFKGVAIFIGTKFSDNVYFTDAKFDKDLIFEGARIYSIQLDNAAFADQSRISLNDTDFTRFDARWNAIKDRLIFNGAAYQALVKNYKNLEWFDDADGCYYQYRMTTMSEEPWGWIKIIDIISWLSCGFGVRVSYVTFWCLFTIIFFGFVYWAGNGMRRFELSGKKVPGEGKDKRDTKGDRTSLVDALYFSTAMFTTSQAPYYNYPIGFYRHLAMFEGIIGWFFLGLFVVVLSGVLIR